MNSLLAGDAFARASQAAIAKAARDAGFFFTTEQVRDIAQAERACLAEHERVSFGEGAAAWLVQEYASSPFIAPDDAAQVLKELVEAFYELRADYPAVITDAEIIESLAESFNGDAAGNVDVAAMHAANKLSERWGSVAYSICDDESGVYRWDPNEWHDDVFADGWYGERWEDVDE